MARTVDEIKKAIDVNFQIHDDCVYQHDQKINSLLDERDKLFAELFQARVEALKSEGSE